MKTRKCYIDDYGFKTVVRWYDDDSYVGDDLNEKILSQHFTEDYLNTTTTNRSIQPVDLKKYGETITYTESFSEEPDPAIELRKK